jgi:hypothetical protein
VRRIPAAPRFLNLTRAGFAILQALSRLAAAPCNGWTWRRTLAEVTELSHRSHRSAMLPLSQIRQIDYTVIFARNMDAMRDFYETIMEFPLLRALSDRWIEYRCPNTRESLQCASARPIRASLSSKACRA